MVAEELLTSTSQVLMASHPYRPPSGESVNAEVKEVFAKSWRESIRGIRLPAWCEPEELVKHLTVETEEYYVENNLADRLQRIRRLSRNYGEVYIRYTEAFEDYARAISGVMERDISGKPHMLYRSDLPLSMISKLNLWKHSQGQTYLAISLLLNSFVNKAGLYKSDRVKFQNLVELPFARHVGPLCNAFNACDRSCSALVAFMRVWSADSYQDIDREAPFSMKRLEMSELHALNSTFERNLYEVRNSVLKVSPNIFPERSEDSDVVRVMGGILLEA